MKPGHTPVMMEEVLEVLPLAPGATVVDGTVGLAGHALEMARRIAPGGLIVAMDWDKEMLERARARLAEVPDVQVFTAHADYRELPAVLAAACLEHHRKAQADAVLLDLGLNNAQIEDPSRGISFQQEGPLDMRMDRSRGESAAAWLNRASASEIENVIFAHGDERWAKKIALRILERRPLKTTQDLVDCVLAAIPPARREKRLHPATRTFQAVRIHVNQELDELGDSIEETARILRKGGVLCVLSYHSGEDRAVKHAFRALAKEEGFEELDRKPRTPSPAEVAANPKSRSAKMRTLRRVN
ncbi:MAG: 16S rRNA (cytosine(1402)-N(4))-methyltransferase RsmH [Fimbriimonadaceae bacterium]|nr:16S rRNA (cytosine(1402)-N(4))-methyltransferase RsmH [Fimbriimonadaceae bacterium]QYK55289.1 MAG: 16S rRNA (cytosine(1402)-N(4))-methyltransferase RsmH [Fimbriimonadaceae bacterium]